MSRVASSKIDEAPVAPMTLDRSLTDPLQNTDGFKAGAPPAPAPPRKPSHVAARAGPPGRKASVVNVVPGSRRQSVQEMPDVIGLRRSSIALFAETPVVALPRPQSHNAVPQLSIKEIESVPTASQKMPAAPRGEETIVDEKPLLLVVDDSEMTRKMLCRIVKVHGYDYDEAEDGAVAVAKVESNLASAVGRKYVGILMDFVMYVVRLWFPPFARASLSDASCCLFALSLQACDGRPDGHEINSGTRLPQPGAGRDRERARL